MRNYEESHANNASLKIRKRICWCATVVRPLGMNIAPKRWELSSTMDPGSATDAGENLR
jgi:hypothetical protein